ncbi:MAG: flagellar biosynthesis anti-sigma factor FlgM [Betaproteobacteria bacterium]
MKITSGIDSTGPLERGSADQGTTARARPTAGAAGGAAATDTIRISELSAQLAGLEDRLAADGSFDGARVEAIKDAMRDGRFRVNPEAVADKLIESVRELLRKPS